MYTLPTCNKIHHWHCHILVNFFISDAFPIISPQTRSLTVINSHANGVINVSSLLSTTQAKVKLWGNSTETDISQKLPKGRAGHLSHSWDNKWILIVPTQENHCPSPFWATMVLILPTFQICLLSVSPPCDLIGFNSSWAHQLQHHSIPTVPGISSEQKQDNHPGQTACRWNVLTWMEPQPASIWLLGH